MSLEKSLAPYELVVGLEAHVQLATTSKMFCGCSTAFGARPNTQVCPVCMGLPGALPVLNREAVRLAALAGLALEAGVQPLSRFDRKHYFYPDLPKGYQISQFFHPLCQGGRLVIQTGAGPKAVGITRIHMEEDAGKLLHDGERGSLLDLNRCGVPLIEIVSGPDLASPQEAAAYLRGLRAVLTYAGVSDCKMNEGSLRCDVNLSLRLPGGPLGVRTEIKNLNSFQSVERAIQAEALRQAQALRRGESVLLETRRYDPKTGLTQAMRPKESSGEYRFFPEPDLPWVAVPQEALQALRASLPELPAARRERFAAAFGLSPYGAEQLTARRWLADYFEEAAALAQSPESVANLLLGEVFAQLSLRGKDPGEEEGALPIAPRRLAALSDLLVQGKVNSSTGKRILGALFEEDFDPGEYALAHDLLLIREEGALREAAIRALEENQAMAQAYREGKTNVLRALMGKAMALTGGKADPRLLEDILRQLLEG
ncbi:MAG: Asp-tRNA(Asn)/Glu-tRNA(Gln) amidotransferase subunit GatB [Candidatus Limiplasma sp.]|nr:Asp-tRNA(Asn)/Glu-tRNA(Gln) amidotransferase subunit GatB [Candidatus Limiplasma sp.]